MKLGLIADIHADYEALEIVLERLRQAHQVDMILCAGDLVGYGIQPNEVVSLFREQQIPTVKGNHDSPSADITPENADYLRQLPMQWQMEYTGCKVFMCHGIPDVNFVGFSERLLERDRVQDMVRALETDYVIAGHTHFHFCARLDNTWILNPGAVYARNAEGTSHSYGVLDTAARTFVIYDVLAPLEVLTTCALDRG